MRNTGVTAMTEETGNNRTNGGTKNMARKLKFRSEVSVSRACVVVRRFERDLGRMQNSPQNSKQNKTANELTRCRRRRHSRSEDALGKQELDTFCRGQIANKLFPASLTRKQYTPFSHSHIHAPLLLRECFTRQQFKTSQ